MTESINQRGWGEETNLLCRRNPNKLCPHSYSKEAEHNSPFLKCWLCMVNSFQRAAVWTEGGRITLQWRNLGDITSSRWSGSASTMISPCALHVYGHWCLTSVAFLLQTHKLRYILTEGHSTRPLTSGCQKQGIVWETVKTTERGLRRQDTWILGGIWGGILEHKNNIR